MTGHTETVGCAAFSADGTRIITGNEDGTAKVWDAQTDSSPMVVGDNRGVLAAAFSPVEDRMVVAGNKVTIWDTRTGTAVKDLDGLAGRTRCVAYSPDGTLIVAAGGDFQFPGKATVWDARTGAALCRLKDIADSVNDVAFSPDGKWVVTAGVGGRFELKIWDARTGALLHDLTPDMRGSTIEEIGGSIAFSPDASRFVAGGIANPFEAVVWNAKTLEPQFSLKCKQGLKPTPARW